MAEQRDLQSTGPRLPLFLDLKTRLVVIFGGGAVGERKARLFSQYGPVRVLSRDFSLGILELAKDSQGRVELVECDLTYDFGKYLQGAFIVIPATSDSNLNRAIEEEARDMNILVNNVEGPGDVVVPSILQRGCIAIAISTESPALTKYLRLRLEEELTDNYQEMARLINQIRRENKEIVSTQKDRARIIWEILLDDEVWRLLEVSYEKAYMRARSHVCLDERDSLDAGDTPQGLH
ncbi:MAG: bifunctional precorrin-2 dehydrogenase/sirohydrochlorin ferrochelatase [Methanothrix sp.]|nr:bifunctional precorrin-2 dehydrogenase/sirohydrochlorin ferrochelatase [Methanothrix sp.]MDD4446126.1 bifunctional precorrin-2 dehydrogenase/sirohydrochlorin ferrochelatase [Methanothrix sp.]